MSILIKGALIEGKKKDIYIQGNIIKKIGEDLSINATITIDAQGKASIPSLMNMHTHAAMTLFRGYADDMDLDAWLTKKIWPIEERMDEEDVYWGAKLACLEMIKTGTTFFNDMYWHWHGTARAVEEMGMRVLVSGVIIDLFNKERARKERELNERLFEESKNYSERVSFSLGPHAIYTVSEESLRWVKRFADENNLFIHLHLCETEKERKDCIKQKGLTPVRYLEKIGVLGPNLIAAHCNWLEEDDVRVLVDYGVKVVMNPTSNMKLASCGKSPYHRIKEKGGTCLLGTDGPSSNNNLDMFEAMKMAALFEKLTSQDPTHLSSEEAFSMSTREPALAIGINCGVLEVGKLADLLLIDLGRPEFVPGHNFISDLVYATSGACVDTVICDGKILMKDGKVKDEEVIKEKVRERIYNLFKRQ